MARIVLVAFEDNATADSWVRQVVADGSVWQLPPSGREFAVDGRAIPCKIEAVVARPTRWCRCAVPEVRSARKRRGRRESGWTRSVAYGWWVCVHCGKPSKPVIRHWVTGMLNGANDMLPKILRIGEPISPHKRWLGAGGMGEEKHHNIPQRSEFLPCPYRISTSVT